MKFGVLLFGDPHLEMSHLKEVCNLITPTRSQSKQNSTLLLG